MEGLVYRFLWSLMNVVLRVHVRRIYVTGRDKMPAAGPAIFACNHTNAFFDAVLTATMMPVRYRLHFMTRADIFKGKWIPVLRAMSLIPVYRMRDGRDQLSKNADSFEETQRVLNQGKSILIFSEGICIVEKRVQKLLKGTARMAFQAAEAGVKNLMVIPVGINYSSQTEFRMEVYLNYGKGIPIADWMDQYRANPAKTINAFNDFLRSEMIALSNHIEDPANDEAFEVLRSLPFKGEKAPSLFNWKLRSSSAFEKEKRAEKLSQNQTVSEKTIQLTKSPRQAGFKLSAIFDTALHWSKQANAVQLFPALLIFLLALPFTALPKWISNKIVEKKVNQPMFVSSVRMTVGMLVWFIWWLCCISIASFFLSASLTLIIGVLGFMSSMWAWSAKEVIHNLSQRWQAKRIAKQHQGLIEHLDQLQAQLSE